METVLYVPQASPGPRPTVKPPKTVGRTFGLEKLVFSITRFFVLGLSTVAIIGLVLLGVGFLSTVSTEKELRKVTYAEIVNSFLPDAPSGKSDPVATVTKDHVPIPENVRVLYPNASGLTDLMEGVDVDQQGGFLGNLSDILAQAKSSGVDQPSKLVRVSEKYAALWREKARREGLRTSERLVARAAFASAAFGFLLILATLSIVLVLLAIERNTRARSTVV